MLVLATENHIEDIIRLTKSFIVDNSIYKGIYFDDNTIGALAYGLINKSREEALLVLLKEGNYFCGLFVAVVEPVVFGNSRIARELIWWVDPEYRKGKESLKLLNAFEFWAKEVAKVSAVSMVSLAGEHEKSLDRLYKSKGYKPVEITYLKDL